MRLLLLAAACLACSLAFPMCTNGSTPLMEANDAFTCDRGCPLGFNCEFQDADQSMSKAICCPNMKALQQLYGDEEHSEPIWDLSQVADLSAGIQSVIEGASKTSGEAKISAEDTLSSQEHTETTSTDGTERTKQVMVFLTTEVVAQGESTSASTINENSTTEVQKTTTETAISLTETVSPEETTVLSETANVKEPKETNSIASTAVIENSISESATLATVNIIVEIEGSGEGVEEPVVFQKKSCARQKFSLTCHDGKVKTQATIRWFKNSDTEECEFYPFGYCPGDRIIESVTIRTRTECEEHCIVGKGDTQGAEIEPTPTDSSKFNAVAEETLPSAEFPSEQSSTSSPKKTTSLAEAKTSSSLSLAIEDLNVEKKSELVNSTKALSPTTETSGTEPTTTQYEPNDSLPKIAIEDPVVEHKQEVKDLFDLTPSSENITEQEIKLNSEKQLQSSLSSNQEKGAQHPDKVEQGTGIPETAITQETMAEKGPNNTKNIGHDGNVSGESEEEVNQEVIEGISGRKEVVEKLEVACSAGTYRYVCDNGHPSQFVYRWENVDGVCQSFPYGYCYGEFNHAHPRTINECQQYCSISPNRVFSL